MLRVMIAVSRLSSRESCQLLERKTTEGQTFSSNQALNTSERGTDSSLAQCFRTWELISLGLMTLLMSWTLSKLSTWSLDTSTVVVSWSHSGSFLGGGFLMSLMAILLTNRSASIFAFSQLLVAADPSVFVRAGMVS